jgi:hypothetical protein
MVPLHGVLLIDKTPWSARQKRKTHFGSEIKKII